MILLRILARYAVRRAANQILLGRVIDKRDPKRGRFLRHDVDRILARVWRNFDDILPQAELHTIPTRGSRQNVFLCALTVAAYHALLDEGVERTYAIELFADIGWKVYSGLVELPRRFASLVTRDPQRQLNLIIRTLMVYPFNAPGRPAYECKTWAEPGRLCTDWTFCPPYDFVRRYIEKNGDRGELAAFRQSWCQYDWGITQAMMSTKKEKRGYYERKHTLSAGDAVCDMRWYAVAPPEAEESPSKHDV